MTHDEQLKELKRDKERLEGLETLLANENDLDLCRRDDGYHITPIFDQEKEVVQPSLRKAIDAAIAQSKSVNTAKTIDPIWDSRNQDYE